MVLIISFFLESEKTTSEGDFDLVLQNAKYETVKSVHDRNSKTTSSNYNILHVHV